jgi:peroxiredoxin
MLSKEECAQGIYLDRGFQMRRKRNDIMIAAVALLAASLAVFSGPERARAGAMGVKVDQKAPDFSLKALDGRTYNLADYRGRKIVMLEFWATWCGVCKSEMPDLVKEYNDLKPVGFELLGVTLQTGDVAEVREIAEKNKLPYPVLLDESLIVATKLYKLAGPIPLKVIIDGNGVVRYEHVGDYPPGENEIPDVVKDLARETLPAPVNLNTADRDTLANNLRIDPALADAVIKGRPYQSVDELARVKEFPLDMVRHLLFCKP